MLTPHCGCRGHCISLEIRCEGCQRIIASRGDLHVLLGCSECFEALQETPVTVLGRWLNLPNALSHELEALFENIEERQLSLLVFCLIRLAQFAFLFEKTVIVAIQYQWMCVEHRSLRGRYF